MGRCLHLDNNGRACNREADPDTDLCSVHGDTQKEGSVWTAAGVRKIVFRLAAALLLLTFLVQGYLLLKTVLGAN